MQKMQNKIIKKSFYLFIVFLILGSSACSKLNRRIKPPEGMVYVPAGDFYMGSNEVDTEAKSLQYGSKIPLFANERPMHKVYLPAFYIDKYEVSNNRYKRFVDATGHEPPPYFKDADFSKIGNLPVVYVSWFDARAFCKWEGKRLPTEAEWEKAARGTDGRRFPWGNEWDPKKVNGAGTHQGPMDVTSMPQGKSPYGAYNMAGNVYEWTASWYDRYEGNTFDDSEYGKNFKVVRGGSWGGVGHYSLREYLRASYRFPVNPEGKYADLGFRCAKGTK